MAMLNIMTKYTGNLIKSASVLGRNCKGSTSFRILETSNATLYSHAISKQLQLVTKEKSNYADNKENRPLMLLYTWTLAQEKHIMKFTKLYTELGFDVLKVNTPIQHLVRPTKGTQVTASHLLQFLHENSFFSPLAVHGISVGCYAFGEALVKMDHEAPIYDAVKNKFIGQIWDSPVDVHGLPFALSAAVTTNKTIQRAFEKILEFYLKLNYDGATVHYNKSSSMIHANALGTPGLFIYSKTDFASPPEMNESVYLNWEKLLVHTKCFENSVHASHFAKYPEEYMKTLKSFLSHIEMLPSTV